MLMCRSFRLILECVQLHYGHSFRKQLTAVTVFLCVRWIFTGLYMIAFLMLPSILHVGSVILPYRLCVGSVILPSNIPTPLRISCGSFDVMA